MQHRDYRTLRTARSLALDDVEQVTSEVGETGSTRAEPGAATTGSPINEGPVGAASASNGANHEVMVV